MLLFELTPRSKIAKLITHILPATFSVNADRSRALSAVSRNETLVFNNCLSNSVKTRTADL